MKVLLVGGGGREHALAWKMLRDDPSIELICAPGNAGIAEICECVAIKPTDVETLAAFARSNEIALTVVGPEAPLEAGIADAFINERLPIFGPTQSAARVETSKSFAKRLMHNAGVPTARASMHSDLASAKRAVTELGAPVVVKASGLAAGKGVVVAQSVAEAENAIDAMLGDRSLGDAGSEVLVEEFMEGEELSLFAITDGTNVIPLLPAQDHKRLLDDDLGPNTGGMGAYAPVSLGTTELVHAVCDRIFEPTLAALRKEQSEFRGLLYAGLMITSDGPKVVEFNCRFGDPETQAILPLMRSSLLDLFIGVAYGDSLRDLAQPEWRDAFAVTTVLAAGGYPQSPRLGNAIRVPAAPNDILIFHAGTKRGAATDELLTAGGRVLAITAVAESLQQAVDASRSFAERVSFDGKQMRRDIGYRELERHARAT